MHNCERLFVMKMSPQTTPDGIAIIGMACVFPDAHSPEALWENVLAGRRAFRKLPEERLPRDLYYDPNPRAPGKTYCDQVAVITDWKFNPLAFQIPPVTVEATDPTHWLALWTARAAFANAGLDLAGRDRSRIGVILGNTLGGEYGRSTYLRYRWPFVERAFRRALASTRDHDLKADAKELEALLESLRHYYLSPLPGITEDSLAGAMSNTIAGRICNYFDLGGGGYTIDGACSSSLLAVANACEAVARGALDVALTGGVDISLDPYELVGFAKTQALAADDIRPYDERASGMLAGEGCGLVVLMREADARASNCRVRAVIRGWGYSSDGRGGITAPRREGQIRALRRAYERAGFSISTVGLIEGHGTGTPLGDRVELGAILELMAGAPGEAGCRIGSIKGNIGHCKAAAGAAGLIKAVMALERKILPPTAGCEQPHPLFGRPFGPLAPALEGEVWEHGATSRRASVSSFGFGGSNAHLALEESGPDGITSSRDLALLGSSQATELVLVSAPDREALVRRIDRLRAMAARISRAELTDLAASLARSDAAQSWRLAIVATSPWHLAGVLNGVRTALDNGGPPEALAGRGSGVFAGVVPADGKAPSLVALFPGQGAQRPAMGAHFARRYPFVQEMYDECDAAIADLVPGGVKTWIARDVRQAGAGLLETWNSELSATTLAQPAIVATSLATLRVLKFHGLCPDIFVGHSLGEISALCAAGACDPVTAVRIAALRGRAMHALSLTDAGAMAAVAAEPAVVEGLIAPLGPALVISNYNSPRQTVVSGDSEAIAQLIQACRRQGILCKRLPVSHAFHSDWVAPAAGSFRRDLDDMAPGTLRGRVISTATGDVLQPGVALWDHLGDHVRRPVRFTAAVRQAQQGRPALWIEAGPGAILTGLVQEILGPAAATVLTTDRPGVDGLAQLDAVLGQAFVLGFPIDTGQLFAHRFCRPFSLQDYAPLLLVNPCERPVSPPDLAPEPVHPVEEVQKDEPNERARTLAFVMDWIAQRTGYPRASISPELWLRDDLNLDSIKAMELIQVLAARKKRQILPRPGWENLPIVELVDAVLSSEDAGALSDKAEQGFLLRAARLEGIEPGGDWVHTFGVGLIEAPLAGERALLPPRVSIWVIASRGCGRARAVAETLTGAGFAPVVVDLETLLRERERPTALGAIVWILPETGARSLARSSATFAQLAGHATTLFRLARWALGKPASRATQLRWLVLRPDDTPTQTRAADAGAAFFKSLRLEYPGLLPKWIRLPSSWPARRWGQMVVAELGHGGARVGYAYDVRGRRMAEAALPLETKGRPLALDRNDVVLVTGGARGVTRELALTLARETGAQLALVGTSPAGDPEVQRSCRGFETAGARVRYFACDVTEGDAVRELCRVVKQELGPVTALLHGAGITRPALFEEMSLDAYLRCIEVKAAGLDNLLAARPPETLKAVHVLSSVLGYTGMARQVDYTFANAWLDGALAELHATHPSLHVLALAYSLWQDIGLGAKLGVAEVLGAMGVTAIDVPDGIAAYRAALQGAGDGARRIVTGRLVPDLEAALFPPPPFRRSRFLERLLRWVPGIEMIAETDLSHDRDPYLGDHVFEGTPILPAVMGIEAMVAAAMACTRRRDLPRLENVRLRLPIVVPQGAAVALRVYALVSPPDGGQQRVRVALRAETDGFAEDRFSAACVFGSPDPSPPQPLERPLPPRLSVDLEAFAPDPLFQGPFFRRLVGLRWLEPGEMCLADVQLPQDARHFEEEALEDLCTPFPAARDAFFQTLLLMSGGGGLPTAIRDVRFLRACPPGSQVVCRGRLVSQDQDRRVLDVDVFTAAGEPVEMLHGVVVEAVGRRVRPGRVALSELGAELARQCKNVPHALAIVSPALAKDTAAGGPRQRTVQANLVAIRQAAVDFARRYHGLALDADAVGVEREESGRPRLRFAFPGNRVLDGIGLSVTDTAELSVAVVGPKVVGIDLEPVEARRPGTWRGLLGPDGYALALQLAGRTGESLNVTATCVWTLIEAGIKAIARRPSLDRVALAGEGAWMVLATETSPPLCFFSTWLDAEDGSLSLSAFTMAVLAD